MSEKTILITGDDAQTRFNITNAEFLQHGHDEVGELIVVGYAKTMFKIYQRIYPQEYARLLAYIQYGILPGIVDLTTSAAT